MAPPGLGNPHNFDEANFPSRRLPLEEAQQLRAHIEVIAKELGVTWTEDPDLSVMDCEGHLGEKTILTAALRNEIHYLAALHELGHIAFSLPTDDEHGIRSTENETLVWEWTAEHAELQYGGAAWQSCLMLLCSDNDGPWPTPEQRSRMKALMPVGCAAESGER